MFKPPTCVSCGATAPETKTSYTLISQQHGWRLTNRGRSDTDLCFEWRCPTCWRRHKHVEVITVPTVQSPLRASRRPPPLRTDAGRPERAKSRRRRRSGGAAP
jgi:hypothetical protein